MSAELKYLPVLIVGVFGLVCALSAGLLALASLLAWLSQVLPW